MNQYGEKEVEEEHPLAVDSELDQSDTAGDHRLLEFLHEGKAGVEAKTMEERKNEFTGKSKGQKEEDNKSKNIQ